MGLYADPAPSGTDFDQITGAPLTIHRDFLELLGTTSGTNPRALQELKNLEAFFLLVGSPGFASGSTPAADTILGVTPGRLGEGSLLVTAIRNVLMGGSWSFPGPGTAQVDDNSNFGLVQSPSLGWPYDYRGVGNVYDTTTGFGKQLRFVTNTTVAAIGPNRWLQFNNYHANGDVTLLSSPYSANLMQSQFNQLSDEAQESLSDVLGSTVTAYLRSLSSGAQPRAAFDDDELFGASETAFLHLSPSDGARVSVGSRLAKLAPANFVGSARAWDIRRQFATVGGDRREAGRATTQAITPSTSSDNTRSWETAFSSAYRGPVQWSLRETVSSSDPLTLQRWKLNANQLLVDQDGAPFPTVASVTGLQFRNLTQHPTSGLTNTPVPTGTQNYASNPPTSSAAYQEYWARVDRQAMARDLYTLLYMYGSKNNGSAMTNPTNAASFHTAEELRQMAQFAINYVDALDPDDVISRFEYDTDLSTAGGGWNLSDNDPYTAPGSDVDRAEVWGVEEQKLTLSEALAILAPVNDQGPMGTTTPMDHTATQWDDLTANYFIYVELQNASPQPVVLNNSRWQVMIWPRGSDSTNAADRQAARQLILGQGGNSAGTVAAGSRFVIGGDAKEEMDMGTLRPSIFRVDRAGGSAYETLIPTSGTLDLDLITDRSGNKFYILNGDNTDQTGTAGSFLDQSNADPATTPTLPLVVSLRRRANLYRTSPTLPVVDTAQEDDNPWIEVDRVEIGGSGSFAAGMQKFDLQQDSDDMSSPTLTTLVENLISAYSAGPFDPNMPNATAAASNLRHTIGMVNDSSNPAGTVTQFHFDRPFLSLAELLEIPTEGHDTLAATGTRRHPLRNAVTYGKLSGDQQFAITTTKTVTFGGRLSAQLSEDINGNGSLDAGEDFNNNSMLDGDVETANQWYRLLNFLELPGQTNRGSVLDTYAQNSYFTPTSFGWPKESGRINPNTVRHHTVLAALLDENSALAVTQPQASQTTFLVTRDTSDTGMVDLLQDASGSTTGARDWWKQFLMARDSFDGRSVDPVSGLVLPGLGNSRPFRGLSFTSRGGLSRDDTLL
ncbi:MAG: hypothetical protein B7Z55_02865, partial [Planctomycetales bacterium 12-60-4]